MRAFALLRHDDGVWDNPQGAFAWTGTAVATRKTDGRMTRMTAVRDTPPKPVVSLPDQGPAKRWNFNV
jgi:hypothetical protein